MHKLLCILGVALTTLDAAAGADPERPVDPGAGTEIGEVETGRGYGLSVFHGTEPERFEVEVLGEFGGLAVGDDYILARLTGAGLEESGVIAGMSGSPVYVDGELIGAIAFAWPFSKEAIGGITPIESMRDQLLAPTPQTLRRPAAAWDELFDLSQPEHRLRERAAILLPRSIGDSRVALQLVASGLVDESRNWLGQGVGKLSSTASSEAGDLVAGSAVAGVLVDGDWRLAVTGTVTDVDGDRVLAFGHPFLGNGSTDLPMAPAEIVSVVSSQWSSFKISNFGRPVGRFDFDRSTGVGGRLGETASTVPLTVSMQAAEVAYSMQLAGVPELLPLLVGLSVFQSTAAGGHLAGTSGLEMEATYDLGHEGELVIRSVHDGPAAAVTAALETIQYTDFLHNNAWQEVNVEAVRVNLTQHPQPISRQVQGASLERTRAEAGDLVRGTVRLKGYRAPVEERAFEFTIPAYLQAGSYQLLVGDARSLDVARWAATGEQPQSFSQALRLLRGLRGPETLAVALLRQAGGLSVDGVALPGLPPSMGKMLADNAGTRPVPWQVDSLLEQPLNEPLAGVIQVKLEIVEPRETAGIQQENNG